jgi:hypothetical protein
MTTTFEETSNNKGREEKESNINVEIRGKK